MNDVALAAKVSTATVSHVLNGTRVVHPDTVRAVNEAIAKVGYTPNILARSLARSASSTIGVAIAAVSNHYFAGTVHAIEAECSRLGLAMLFVDTHDDPAQELRAVKTLHQRRVDGILLAPTADPERRALNYLQAANLPTVLVDRLMSKNFDQIGVENVASTAQMVAHLIGHGHRRIGFIAGAQGLSTTAERLQGYRDALVQAGLPWDASLVRDGQSMIEPARAAVAELLALRRPPTAIVSANNLMTIGAASALRDARLDIPAAMALVGFDDFDWADYFEPRLTVMAQPVKDIGLRAMKLLNKRIKTPDGARQTVRLAPTFVVRRSCGCA
ncbi:LacI family DNA-binding transcriptional regulator [Variovorax sp. 770b2]|uniref:LacI family DNA-binding transcriptional regulator n=1 Tax=Variovorax sp. 770b2 TaxID=1566271 RepID=UPI000B899772|nr:LacI family DNA-binding transcriptional regulator [Variovorax sp. 770b2]